MEIASAFSGLRPISRPDSNVSGWSPRQPTAVQRVQLLWSRNWSGADQRYNSPHSNNLGNYAVFSRHGAKHWIVTADAGTVFVIVGFGVTNCVKLRLK